MSLLNAVKRWWRRNQPPPLCVGCRHSQADHYPGCLNIGPAPEFTRCRCQRFWGSDFPMSSLIPPIEERAKHWRRDDTAGARP